MDKNQCNEYKLNSLVNVNRDKCYSAKNLITDGKFVTHIVFEDKYRQRDVIGKVVTAFSEGEVLYWPYLHHQNLAPLLDVISLNSNVYIFISNYKQINLREIIHDEDFVSNKSCFAYKKIYMENVLWGLDYLHRNSLVHMNISDANIYICLESNTAVITDFNSLTSICKAKKPKFPLPPFYKAPEVSKPNDANDKYQIFNPIAAEMWAFGIMALEVFLQHKVPWAMVDYNCSRALEIMNYIDRDTLKTANKGSVVLPEDLTTFKGFIGLFISYHPSNRCDAQRAAMSMFLQPSNNRMAQVISKNWNQQRNERVKDKVIGDSFIRLNDLSSTISSRKISINNTQQRNELPDEKVSGDSFVGVNGLSTEKSSNTLHSSDQRLTPRLSEMQDKSSSNKTFLNIALSAKSSRELLPVAHFYSVNDRTVRTKNLPSIRKAYSSAYSNRERDLHKQKFDLGLTHQLLENIPERRSLRSINTDQKSSQSGLSDKKIGNMRSKLDIDRSKNESFGPSHTEEIREIQTFKSSFLSLNNETNHVLNNVPSFEALENVQLSQSQMYCPSTKSLLFESFGHESFKSYVSLHNSNDRIAMKMCTESAPVLGDLRSTCGIEKSTNMASTHNVKRKNSNKKGKHFIQSENRQTEMQGLESQTVKDSHLENSKQDEEMTNLSAPVDRNKTLELTEEWKRLPQTSMVEDSHCIFRDRFRCPVHSKKTSYDNFPRNREAKGENGQYFKEDKKNMNLHLYKSGPLSNCYYSQISERANASYSLAELSGGSEIVNYDNGNLKCGKSCSCKRTANGDKNLTDKESVDGFTLNRTQRVERKRKAGFRKKSFIRIAVVPQKSRMIKGKGEPTMGTVARKLKNEKTAKGSSKQMFCHKVKTDTDANLILNAADITSQQISKMISRRSITPLTAGSPSNPKVPMTQDPKVVLEKIRKIQADYKQTMGAVSKKFQNEKKPKDSFKEKKVKCQKMKIVRNKQNEKTPKDSFKGEKVKCQKMKIVRNIRPQPNAEDSTSKHTMISKRSVMILTDESPNNPKVAITKEKQKDKRMSMKKAALYCMCLGRE